MFSASAFIIMSERIVINSSLINPLHINLATILNRFQSDPNLVSLLFFTFYIEAQFEQATTHCA